MLQDQTLEVNLSIQSFVLNSEDRVTNRTQTESLKHAEKSIQLTIYITRSL